MLHIKRITETEVCTIGRASFEDLDFHTLEPPWKDNKKNVSRIRPGVYAAYKYYSPRFKRFVVMLEDKYNRTNIELHAGNYPDQTAGCILVGLGKSENGRAVWRSNECLNKIITKMRDRQEIKVRIDDDLLKKKEA